MLLQHASGEWVYPFFPPDIFFFRNEYQLHYPIIFFNAQYSRSYFCSCYLKGFQYKRRLCSVFAGQRWSTWWLQRGDKVLLTKWANHLRVTPQGTWTIIIACSLFHTLIERKVSLRNISDKERTQWTNYSGARKQLCFMRSSGSFLDKIYQNQRISKWT